MSSLDTGKADRRVPRQGFQQDLFARVLEAYGDADGALSNSDLYDRVEKAAGVDASFRLPAPVGVDGTKRDLFARQVRWYQQTMKHLGLIQRVDGVRGVWSLTGKGKKKLRRIAPDCAMIGFSTRLGLAIWGDSLTILQKIDQPYHLGIASPPYLLAKQRAYGNPVSETEYVDFICATIEPLVRNLVPGGSIVLNLGNDSFERGLPSRSLVVERLTIALHDRLGLKKMDTIPWHNPSKPPGPIVWASKTRQQLNVSWEPILWLCNDPLLCRSDNRRVLQPHSERQLKLMAKGGESRSVSNSDGAYVLKPGSYGKQTAGRIPRNVLTMGHRCKDQSQYKKMAKAAGLPAHGAPFPIRLIEFLVSFLSEQDDVVIDWFSGSFSVGKACEGLGRKWIGIECMLEYVLGGSFRFEACDGFVRNEELWRHMH